MAYDGSLVHACQSGDVNGDGRITVLDAVVVARSLLVPATATIVQSCPAADGTP